MNNYKQIRNKFLSFIFLLTLIITNFKTINVSAATAPPQLNSEGVVLLDADSGEVLYSKNENTKYFPASTTKVLTALVVLENTNLDDKVTIGNKPPLADGTSIGLKEGEIYTVNELLLGLLLESGNDCAEALAEHVAGSNENFAKLMNERAKKLGANDSNFKNPSGLPDEEHVTTPKDLALIMREAIQNKDFVKICSTTTYNFSASNIDGQVRTVTNHNYILLPNSRYYYPYSVASKKGYTIAAKFTNVISAQKDGHTLVASFLRGENIDRVYSDVHSLFDYGFENFKRVKLYSEGDEIGSVTLEDNTEVPLVASKDIYYTTSASSVNNVLPSLNYDNPTNLDKLDFKKGDTLATAKVYVNDKEISSLDLVSGITHEYSPKVINTENLDKNKTYIAVLIGIAILFICYIRVRYLKMKRRRNHQNRLRQIANKQNTQFR